MKKEAIKYCATCVHFKDKQRDLNYWESIGFCTNKTFLFDTRRGRLIGVVDNENKKDISVVTGNPSHNFEVLNMQQNKIIESRYKLQVSRDFGCIYHEK